MSDSSDKLNRTRLAIIEHVYRKKDGRRGVPRDERFAPEGPEAADAAAQASGRFAGWREAGQNWWRQHPGHAALQMATPVLSSYARRQPVKFLAIAAVTGAVLVLARPWKLISLTGVAVALLKASPLPGMVMSAMSAAGYGGNPYDEYDDPSQPP